MSFIRPKFPIEDCVSLAALFHVMACEASSDQGECGVGLGHALQCARCSLRRGVVIEIADSICRSAAGFSRFSRSILRVGHAPTQLLVFSCREHTSDPLRVVD